LKSPIRVHWTYTVPTRIENTWRACSDTDRFNRAAGLGFEFEEEPQDDGTVLRYGSINKFGLKIRWEEMPFEFEAPNYFISRRRFLSGPISGVRTTCRLKETEKGTIIDYLVEFSARNWISRPIVMGEAKLNTKPQVGKTLRKLVRTLSGEVTDFDPPPPELDPRAAKALDKGLRRLEPAIAEELSKVVTHGSLQQQDRIKPLRLADRLKVDPDLAISSCLQAVRDGALELRWEMLCPSCRAPKADSERLSITPGEVHCGSCNIRYDANFPDAVEVVFRPVKSIRDFEVPIDCLLSPQRTPHVLGQARVRANGEIEWNLDLSAGSYNVDTRPGGSGAIIEVREGAKATTATLDLTDRGARPRVLRLTPGKVKIAIRSLLDHAVQASIERRWRPPFTLTAGRLLQTPSARELLPPESLAPGLETRVSRGTVLAISYLVDDNETAILDPGDREYSGNKTSLHTYTDFRTALQVASAMAEDLTLAIGLSVGPIVELGEGDTVVPAGTTVDQALDVMRAFGAGRIGLHQSCKALDDVKMAVEKHPDAELEDLGTFTHALIHVGGAKAKRRKNHRAQLSAAVPKPDTIRDYKIGDEVGRGGMGRVFSATDPKTGKEVVIKVLLPEYADDPEHAQRFYNEARLTSQLRHHNIVRVHDYGEDEQGRLFIVMERLAGRELLDEMIEGTMDMHRVKQIGREVLSALTAAHTGGVLHRDLKPANLFILDGKKGPLVKVIDFGIAHPMADEDELAERGVVVGTPEYMSPEQLDRDPLDARSDLYSLAIVLYQCLTGNLPFEGPNPVAIAMARLMKEPKDIQENAATPIPDELAEVLMRALQLDPPKRYDNAAAMDAALNKASLG